ncbi:MAG: efflux RND transporter periplasmic adaptor subunit, partial [Cyanobacteria bacterium J06648_11]
MVEPLTYTGTTYPDRQVTLRSRIAGEAIDLPVDVGDAIARGDILARLDGELQTAMLNEAEAELSARRAETAQAEVSISDARAAVVQAQSTRDQAHTDAMRLRQLADQGAISEQEAEAAELTIANAEQALLSAQAQVDAQQQAIASAADRIDSQQAIVEQAQRQLERAVLRSPLTGVVLSRQVDVGDFVETGTTVLEIGDLSSIEVTVRVSELDIGRLSVGQPVEVKLDAFPNQAAIVGRIERMAPVAHSTSRLLPVQVKIPNPDGRIGSGLLARVQFASAQSARLLVPLRELAE